jgi:hypothetical protein
MSSQDAFEQPTIPRVDKYEVDAILEQHDRVRERSATLIEKSMRSVDRTGELIWASIGRLILFWRDRDSDSDGAQEPKAG